MIRSWSRDIVVLGGGLSGLRAASEAAVQGASVTLLEKQDQIGGSSALSAGMYWTAPDLASYRQRIPHGDQVLATRILAGYEADLAAIRASGVYVDAEATLGVMGFGRGYSFDVKSYLRVLENRLLQSHGEVHTSVRIRSVTPSGTRRFCLETESADGRHEIHTDAIILATGGFQASPEHRAAHMPEAGADLLLRANEGSEGDGLNLAVSLGAALAGDLATFYGHLVPHPVAGFTPDRFMLFSQYYSNHGILVAADGRRICEESRGDEILNQDLAEVDGMTAFLIFDEEVRSTFGVSEPFANFGRVDRFAFAVKGGARHAQAETLEELVQQLGELGVDAAQLTKTLSGDVEVSSLARRVSRSEPPSARQLEKLRKQPFYALEVQPAITFTLGGIAIDDSTAVLSTVGERIEGVYAVGADVGGFSNYGYAGGLAPAHITGTIAGSTAARFVTQARANTAQRLVVAAAKEGQTSC
ncbi:succinate dehydrogenase/fumarate reductase flavoprotein subunit [Arthrobacter ginsengisoli]|uniref:Succinate dehydrogenase/fumarate reductase flavoprotein subunit n=1 Tax=Arthrobacter ginsengisoli TaxID=1356565 RepID=A0ABU1U9P0_9MICC|nr:FAD-dependent oxidoreductase [Arthrobacter ginsengisoli]MDR7081840.1 succinate dehydrogenase/fumarate reductase flavoprotein subunit [Arthrobacter ginsengisoli]